MPEGEMGELVITTMTKEAMPVIRYRTRDLTRLLPGTARTMRRMEKITGRSDDMIILRGVNVFPTQIEEQLMAVDGLAPHFQIELHKEGALDKMRVMAESLPETVEEARRAKMAADLRERIKGVIGITAEVVVGPPETVERSQGKARRVVDHRGG